MLRQQAFSEDAQLLACSKAKNVLASHLASHLGQADANGQIVQSISILDDMSTVNVLHGRTVPRVS